jgi:hypothetical protein
VEVMPPKVEDRKRPETIEDCFSEIMLFSETVKKGEFGVVVVDSIDGLLSEEVEAAAEERVANYKKGKTDNDGLRGQQKALFLSRIFFPKLNSMVEKKSILLIIISQYRQGSGQYGPKQVISNGEAIKFYTHSRVKINKKEENEVNGRSIGTTVGVETIKMKGPWPYRSCYVSLHYNTASNIDYLYDLRTAERGELKKKVADSLLKWDDQEMNRYDLIRYIESNNLERDLRKRVRDKWDDEEAKAAKELEGRKSRYAE